jgi:penicillin amidase
MIRMDSCRCRAGVGGVVLFLATTAMAAPDAAWGRVELIRDRWGTPHVFADTDEGAMYGLGHAVAEDRLYQMNFNLRLMQGRLAEAVGDLPKRRQRSYGPNSAVAEDRLMRTLGFARAAERAVERLSPGTRALLQAYCSGVNDHVMANADSLHPLFEKQGWRPEPWTEADCLLSWWQVARFFSSDGLRDLWSLKQQNNPGRPMMAGREPVIDDDAAVVRREDVTQEWIDRTLDFMREHGLAPDTGTDQEAPGPKFSHAWVIGGAHTTTGSAVLVSDPQTPVWNPSLFHEFHVVGRTFNVRGMGVSGSPFVLIGFNANVAWGVTALGADQADLFVLKTDSDRPDQYEVDGQWRKMAVREEMIRVAGGDPVPLKVRETAFGPVVSEFALGRREEEVAVKRVPLCDESTETHEAGFAMMRAASAEELLTALADWRFPSANCVFGDRAGNIGYTTVGAIPVRSAASPELNLAHDGSLSANDWQGFVPAELLPHVLNPRRGYLVTANHRSIQSFYRLTLGNSTGSAGDTDRGWRIKQRIQQALAESEKVRPEEVLAMQSDAVNAVKQAILRVAYLVRDRQGHPFSESAAQALEYLKDWYEAGARSETGVRGTEVVNQMNILFRAMAEPLAETYGGGVSGLVLAMKTLTRRVEAAPDRQLSDEECAFIDRTLSNAWEACRSMYGRDPALWNALANGAGQGTRLGYLESLSGYVALDEAWSVQRPLLQVLDGGTILAQPGQSYTQYVPLHDPDQALSLLPPGPSENPASPYRFSNLAAWSAGELHPAPLSRNAVRKLAASARILAGNEATPPRSTEPGRSRRTADRRQ